uniref:Gamma-tubulin complex component n=1 Tax=Xiphophorus couchianus TaxID=32473 RepID=A0A3B5L776_9TELE
KRRAGPPGGVQTERETKRLVRCLSGVQDEEDQNFQLALKFAWSNFKFHRYLDADSHKIQRTINGIYEKLMVHSDLSKAGSWRRLTEEFLTSPLPNTNGAKTDTHYGILSLLLFLSDSPSNTNFTERPRVKDAEPEDEFDWAKYLMEGEDVDAGPFPDTPDWSEDESEDDDRQQPISREDSGIQLDRTPQEDQDTTSKTVPVAWTVCASHGGKFEHSEHLSVLWELSCFFCCCFLILGCCRVFVLQNCLHSVLEHVAVYGQAVFRLQRFIDEVTGHSSEPGPPGPASSHSYRKGSEPPFRTYQAFVWALNKYFASFKEELTAIEREVISNDETVTLSGVLERLSPHLAQIKVLHKVFCTGVAEVPPATPNVVRASHLLNTLYKAIIEYDSVGDASEQAVALLFSLWTETVRPYLEIVDEWIVHGHLFDPAKEFIIQRNKDVPVNHRDFWYATYTLYSVSEMVDSEEKLNDAASGSSGGDPGSSNRQLTMVSFLKPVLKQIIMAGKSMQLLKNLHCKEKNNIADAERKSLYTVFLESVQSRLSSPEESPNDKMTEQQATTRSIIKMQSIMAQHLEIEDVHDPLLAINFARLYLEQSDFHERFSGGDFIVDRSSQSVTCQTFELTLRSCLYPHIERRYIECCGNLMKTLKKDYKLLEYLQAMRNYFLLEAGDTMYDFYTAIFDKVQEKESWQQPSFLNVLLQEAVGQRYPEDSSRLSVFLEPLDASRKKHPVNNLEVLTLSYKVPWPVDIVISSECQKIYNQVFLLLLQIKWAKYSLDTLRFSEVTKKLEGSPAEEAKLKEPISQQIHRMCLLRVKLMHFVNSLHNYIMTRILHSTGLEFQHQVQEAKDLDQLIKIHYRYLATIHDRCLLREKVSFVKEAIMKVLNLVLIFSDRWQAGFGAWKIESIDKMESDLKNCHMFLVTILNKAVCRGSFPHLESLALSLMAGFEQC